MPGVIDGQPYWEEQDSQIRGFGSRSHQRAMSPYHHGNEKMVSRSHHSNGYGSDHHSESNDDGATYLLEHLATFSVGNQYGLVAPKDGLRRLLQMEKSSGIWTQKMQMRLERNWVIIIDYENGDIVERFPMSLISDPTAFTSDGRRELYNNILIFIVREDPKTKSHNPSEMHIFQCAQVSAQDVVDEIKMFMSGKTKARYKDNMRQLPPPPSNPPPDPPVNGLSGISVREQVNMFNAAAAAANSHYSPHREMNYPHQRIERTGRDLYVRESNDETSSTTSEKYEQDVAILNHCFDDIERFIARLQHAAAAYKELERRQKNRKNKKKDMGDGMLSMRAKPPPEREFIDILQKFKLSFNLLAKLKSHIHDPNAPELVHFLFTPLALIIDAAKDSNYSTNLASRVITPLLTRDSIELLTNCCTSKETDLWHSLGEPWVIPREQWKDFDKEYHPVFSDGWAPEYPSFDERDHPDIAAAAAPMPAYHRNEVVTEERDYHQMYSREEKPGRYDAGFFYSHEKHGNHTHGSSPSGIGDRHSHSVYESRPYEDHDETNRRDFSSERESRFPTTTERDNHDRDVRSDFSADSIEHTSNSDPHKQFEWQQQQWLEELKSQNAKIVQVVYPRTANNDKELTVIRGEFLEVLDDSRKWWKARNMRGQVAHVPHTIITPYNSSSLESEVFNNPLYATKGSSPRDISNESPVPKANFEEIITSSQDSPSRRPPSIPTPASADWVRRERQGKKDSIITDQEYTQKISMAIQTEDNDSLQPISFHSLLENKNHQSPLKECANVQTSDNASPVLSEEIFKCIGVDNVKECKAIQTETDRELYSPQESVQSKINHKILIKNLMNWEDSFETWETTTSNNPIKNEESAKVSKGTSHLGALDAKEAQKLLQKEVEINRPPPLGSKINKKWICPKHNKSSCSYLKLQSNVNDVKHWLEVKGFSEKTQIILDSMNGEMLFSLKKEQLEKYLGEEGQRLYSHLMIQRNIAGIKTTRSQELKNILEQRRKLTDENVISSDTSSLEIDNDETIDKELNAKLLQFLSGQYKKYQLN